jgi:hypothetical protein
MCKNRGNRNYIITYYYSKYKAKETVSNIFYNIFINFILTKTQTMYRYIKIYWELKWHILYYYNWRIQLYYLVIFFISTDFVKYATLYLNQVLDKVTPLLRGNGGPIIMVQVILTR